MVRMSDRLPPDGDDVSTSSATIPPNVGYETVTLPILPGPAANDAEFLRQLLSEQQQLTAVEEFARLHEASAEPAQAKYYSRLLPAAPPAEGQQYAFEVDLDRCSGCKACVTACHSLNGLDDGETWRDVGLLIGGTSANPQMQHVTTACHHCLEPACMTACPVDAYEKDAETGIVKHLYDQCFGCQYCTLACPYDVPKYHRGKGIVRKCDMCSDRLATGEAPACVQACPHEAIAITVVDTPQVLEDSEANHFLPAAPEPHITLPTTTYKTRRVFPRNMLPADYFSASPQHPHWPLVIMLVLTQLSVGAFAVWQVLEQSLSTQLVSAMRPVQAGAALFFGLLALGASVFHLGRPQYAFRAVLGLRHSWLSREIIAFGIFAGFACLYALSSWTTIVDGRTINAIGWAVAISGTAGVFCSVMIYVFTKREFWGPVQAGMKFLLTSVILGVAATWLTLLILSTTANSAAASELLAETGSALCQTLIIATLTKLSFEGGLFRHLFQKRNSPLKRSARLMAGELSNTVLARFACGLLGGIVMPLFLMTSESVIGDGSLLTIVTMLFTACVCGELLERYLFFAAVSAPRMPGGLRS